jgi:formate dehydrogenase assembly factor FdhD
VPLLRDRAMVAAALAAGITVIAAHALPLKLAVLAAAATGIGTGMLFEARNR